MTIREDVKEYRNATPDGKLLRGSWWARGFIVAALFCTAVVAALAALDTLF